MLNLTRMVEVNGKRYLVTDQNQLTDLNTWDSDIRDWLAAEAQISLSEEHASVLDFIRATYQRRHQHPLVRVITAHIGEKFGPEKGNLRYFYRLFPKGIQQAVTIAGLPLQGLCF